MHENYFLKSIQALRHQEEILLFEHALTFSAQDIQEVVDFLALEYERESMEYPYIPPDFDPLAAEWAAKTVYVSTQLLLFRESSVDDIASALPAFSHQITPSAILSSDLCFRFIPSIIRQLVLIDSQDELISFLESHLLVWHYSGITYPLDTTLLSFESILSNPSLHQLYINRVLSAKNINLALHPACRQRIDANISIFAEDFWKEFTMETRIHDNTNR
jgi:hypothetical protein